MDDEKPVDPMTDATSVAEPLELTVIRAKPEPSGRLSAGESMSTVTPVLP